MGIFRGSIIIGAIVAAAFLKLPAFAENPAEAPRDQSEVPEESNEAKDKAVAEANAVSQDKTVAEDKTAPEEHVVVEETKSEETAKELHLFRHASYPEAWTASQKSNRPILLFVSMGGCPHCDKMMAESYHAPQMEKMISESFEPVYVTRKEHPKLVKSLKIKWYPTTVLVGPNNKIMDVIEGYVDAKTFRRRLQTGLATANTPVQTR